MKKQKHINPFLGLFIIIVLYALCSHLEYRDMQETMSAEEAMREDEADMRLLEYHENK